MKKKIIIAVAYILAFITVCANGVCAMCESLFPNINNLPEGHLIISEENPKDESRLNIYLIESAKGYGIRGEIEKEGKRENIFWQTDIKSVDCRWEDKNTVVINNLYLDVKRGDTFDCRNGVSILQNDGSAGEEATSQNINLPENDGVK